MCKKRLQDHLPGEALCEAWVNCAKDPGNGSFFKKNLTLYPKRYMLKTGSFNYFGLLMLYQVEIYRTVVGKVPFDEWIESLKDIQAKAVILHRLERVKKGSFGDFSPVGEGVYELRIFSGPGYRIYFAKIGLRIVLLLCGGSKGKQQQDIEKAKNWFKDFKERRGKNEKS